MQSHEQATADRTHAADRTSANTWNDSARIAAHRELSPKDRLRLTIEASRWNRLVDSIARVMEPGPTTENA